MVYNVYQYNSNDTTIIVMIILWHGCNIMVHVVVVNVEVIILKLKYMDLWFSYISINNNIVIKSLVMDFVRYGKSFVDHSYA